MIYRFLSLIILSLLFIIGCEEENNSQEANINSEVKEEAVAAIPVEAMVIKERVIEQKLPLTGTLKANNSVNLIAEVSGKVVGVKKDVGDYVSANQTLAIIDDVIPESQFKQAEAQVLSTESTLKIAKSNFESDKILFENGDISQLEFNTSQANFSNSEAQYLSAKAALSAAKKSYEDTRIKSPISGYVSRKNIEFGTMVSLGTQVYRVVDISKLKLNVNVPQEIVNRVRIGGAAIIKISALNGKGYEGVVKKVSPQADESTGGFMIEIQVPNREKNIKAGMTAKIDLILSKEDKILAIPDYALVTKNDESFVYKISKGTAQLVKIELGETLGDNIVVNSGLQVNDKIVIVGMKNLGIETKVNIEKLYE